MKKTIFPASVVLFSALFLTGCSTTKAPTPVYPNVAQQKLADSAERVAIAQETMVRVQTARTAPAPAPINENLAGVPEELRRPTTIQWSGPAPDAVKKIADIIGYQFSVKGNPPATLPMVNVSLYQVPAVKALEDLGNQVQPFAQIVLDANLKRVEYRYLVVGANGGAPAAPAMTK